MDERVTLVVARKKDWAVSRGEKGLDVYPSKKDAVAAAEKIQGTTPGAIVIRAADGSIRVHRRIGPHHVRKPDGKSVGTKAIENAVWSVVGKRLARER